jgi:replicative DNA helicase|tara:strand:- start:3 stop:1319 length:1317 start_codon:yes stop_codon:yes gene_type:complete
MNELNAIEAEESILASCISDLDGAVYDELSAIITKDDFYSNKNSSIFDSIGKIINNKDEINEVNVANQLRSINMLDEVGGLIRIMSIMDSPCTPLAGRAAAKIVLGKSRARQLARHYKLQLESLNENADTSDVASKTEAEVRKIMDASANADNTLSVAASDLKTRLHSISDGTYVSKKISFGIPHLDEKLDEGGIAQGEVCVIAAPTSCGKSQLALNFVLRNSISSSIPSAIFSFEMPAQQLTKRMTQTCSAVNLKKYVDKSITPHEMTLVDDSIDKIGRAPIYTVHHVRGIDDLRSKARSLKRKHGIKAIVVDYLQLIPFNPNISKHEGISQASHGIKQMAMELDVAVILLVQVNRTGAMRDTGLVLYDLKDSGDIENDADIALLMWPKGGNADSCKAVDSNGVSYLEMDYNVAKNREGERDLKGRFKFINHIGRFQ